MANWYGSARTNYFRVGNEEELRKALEPFQVSLETHPSGQYFCLSSEDEYGGWPSIVYDEEDNEIEFDIEALVMPHLPVGEVLISVECGAEKLRYLTGVSVAYVRKEDGTIQSTYIRMDDIHKQAAEKFGIPLDQIAEPTYQNIPRAAQTPVERERG